MDETSPDQNVLRNSSDNTHTRPCLRTCYQTPNELRRGSSVAIPLVWTAALCKLRRDQRSQRHSMAPRQSSALRPAWWSPFAFGGTPPPYLPLYESALAHLGVSSWDPTDRWFVKYPEFMTITYHCSSLPTIYDLEGTLYRKNHGSQNHCFLMFLRDFGHVSILFLTSQTIQMKSTFPMSRFTGRTQRQQWKQ